MFTILRVENHKLLAGEKKTTPTSSVNGKRKGRQVKLSKKDLEEIKKKVALGNRTMFHQGLADYHGHVSARIPGTRRFFIKPVLAPLGEVAPKISAQVDVDQCVEVVKTQLNQSRQQTSRDQNKESTP